MFGQKKIKGFFILISAGLMLASAQSKAATLPLPLATQLSMNSYKLPPAVVGDGSGWLVTVTMYISNVGEETVTDICPSSDLDFIGSGKAIRSTGPIPAYISKLAPGESTLVNWSYRIFGEVGDSFGFKGTITDGQGRIYYSSTKPGSIEEITVFASPHTRYKGKSQTCGWDLEQGYWYLRIDVYNWSSDWIQKIEILPDDQSQYRLDFEMSDNWGCFDWKWDYVFNCRSWWWGIKAEAVVVPPPSDGNAGVAPNGGHNYFTLYLSKIPEPGTHTFTVNLYNPGGELLKTETVNVGVVSVKDRKELEALDPVAFVKESSARIIFSNSTAARGILVAYTKDGTRPVAPTNGLPYDVGQSINNSTKVAFVGYHFPGTINFIERDNLEVGIEYKVRIFPCDEHYNYSFGSDPSDEGINIKPVEAPVKYSYSFGVTSLSNVTLYPGIGYLSSYNYNRVLGIQAGDTDELWRPLTQQGNSQRAPILIPRSTDAELVGYSADDKGFAYGFYGTTGETLPGWPVDLSAYTERFVVAPNVQIYKYSNPDFQKTYPADTDVAFFYSANSSNTNNKVIAVDATKGDVLWVFNINEAYKVGSISQQPMVDYRYNRLYFPADSNGGTQDSLWAISSLDGSLLWSTKLGDVTNPLTAWDGKIYASTSGGTLYAVDAQSGEVIWSFNLTGNVVDLIFVEFRDPMKNTLFVSTDDGYVWAIKDAGSSAKELWRTPIESPTSVMEHLLCERIWVGSGNGQLYELDINTGAVLTSIDLQSGQIGIPSLDISDPFDPTLIANTENGGLKLIDVPLSK